MRRILDDILVTEETTEVLNHNSKSDVSCNSKFDDQVTSVKTLHFHSKLSRIRTNRVLDDILVTNLIEGGNLVTLIV